MADSGNNGDRVAQRGKGVKTHALWLFGVAAAIYGTYIVYVFAFTMNN